MDSRSVTSVARGVKNWGYREHQFSLTSSGSWRAIDAEWNYMDVPHLNVVHSQADAETLFYTEETTSAVLKQRVGPLSLGAILTIYRTGPDSLAYASSVGPIIMIVESRWRDTENGVASVTTTYRIFTPRGLGFLAPLVQKLLTRNYRILMSEDLPLRERKGSLRLRGYSFGHDEVGHGFLASQDIRTSNVRAPHHPAYEWVLNRDQLTDESEHLLGPDDLSGIRVKVQGASLVFLPRICVHEGACLDGVVFSPRGLPCPWHGRLEKPLATVALSQVGSEAQIAPHWRVLVNENTVNIQFEGLEGE